jgi:hypothetical protein
LEDVVKEKQINYRVVAIDPNDSRREKMEKLLRAIDLSSHGSLVVANIPNGKEIVSGWTSNVGCNAVLEVRKCPACFQCTPITVWVRSSETTVL